MPVTIDLTKERLNLTGTRYPTDNEKPIYICGTCNMSFETHEEMEKHWIRIGINSDSRAIAIIRSAIKVIEKEFDELNYDYKNTGGVRYKNKIQLKFTRRLLDYCKTLDGKKSGVTIHG